MPSRIDWKFEQAATSPTPSCVIKAQEPVRLVFCSAKTYLMRTVAFEDVARAGSALGAACPEIGIAAE